LIDTPARLTSQAPLFKRHLTTPVWIHLPRGFRSALGPNACLHLKRSLYGLSVAPKLWYEHLRKAVLSLGLRQSEGDACLFIGENLFFVQYVDDIIFVAPSETVVDLFVDRLRALGFELTKEDSLCEFGHQI
jgi:Reverse transcriptase (RNA-dependent DNA polymerase)